MIVSAVSTNQRHLYITSYAFYIYHLYNIFWLKSISVYYFESRVIDEIIVVETLAKRDIR